MSYIGKEPQFTQYPSKFFNGDGTAMTVTLDYSPPNAAALLVFIDGVRQDTSAYTLSGTSLTFTGTVPSGTNNVQVVHLGLTVDVGVPSDDTISTVKIQDDAVTSAKLDTNIAIDGDLTVDTNTLVVDSTNNRVGIGQTTPQAILHIASSQGGAAGRILINPNVSSGYDSKIEQTDVGLEFTAVSNSRGFSFKTGSPTPSEVVGILPAGGIVFNGDTSQVNALDDYEEGNWSPELWDGSGSGSEGQTYSAQVGYYTKIGRLVHVSGHMQMTGLGTLNTSQQARVGNLPYNTSGSGRAGGGHITFASGLSMANTGQLVLYTAATSLYFYQADATTGTTSITISNVTASGSIYFTATYRI